MRVGLSAMLSLAAVVATIPVAAAQQDVAPAHMKCVGHDPGWSIDVGPENALLDRAFEPRERAVYRGSLQRLRHLDPEWLVWRGQSIRQSSRVLAIAARREACRNATAAGPPADYRAVISFADGTVSAGCCSARFALDAREAPVADHSIKGADDWSRQLPVLAPGIVRCVNDAGLPVSSVAYAAAADPGRAAVLLRTNGGGLQQCVVNLASLEIEAPQRVAGPGPVGIDRPRFLPAREQPPLVTCGRLERVLDPSGRLVGYLHYDPCD